MNLLPNYLQEQAEALRYQKIRNRDIEWCAPGLLWYGGALELMEYHGREVIISGPYETGKTLAALFKLHSILWHNPNVKALMVRHTYNSLINSAIATFENKILPYPSGHPQCPIIAYGGKSPSWYDYPNGSRLSLGGMDKPSKFLSAEFDIIYVNQAEEILLSDWETLAGRASGRAGNLDDPQIIGDCNPSYPEHWIKKRPSINLITSRHEDNPMLFDPQSGEITKQGERTMGVLDGLTGLRHKRGRLGLWVQSEGVVYDNFDEELNVSIEAEYNPAWPIYWGVDDGYVHGDGPGSANYHPRVFILGHLTPRGELFIFDEYVKTLELDAQSLDNVLEWEYDDPELAGVDSSATQLRRRIGDMGIMHSGATHKVSEGIKNLRGLICDKNKVRLLKIHPRCKHTIREFQTYAYADNSKGIIAGEPAPLKVDDHCMDALRYLAWIIK